MRHYRKTSRSNKHVSHFHILDGGILLQIEQVGHKKDVSQWGTAPF